MENNTVVISGVVVSNYEYTHEINGEKFYTLKINVRRSSGTTDNIILFISDYVIDVSVDLWGEYIYVIGDLRTHNINKHLMVGVFVNSIDVLDINYDNIIDYNTVQLDGHLCKKNKQRRTPNGRTLNDAILAVNREHSHSDYVPVLFWGRNSYTIEKCDIGTSMVVEGRLQSRDYKKDGQWHTTYEVSVQELKIE